MQIYLLVNLMVKLVNDQVKTLHDDGRWSIDTFAEGVLTSDTSMLLFSKCESNSIQLTLWIVSGELFKYAKYGRQYWLLSMRQFIVMTIAGQLLFIVIGSRQSAVAF